MATNDFNLKITTSATGTDEINKLVDAINKMAKSTDDARKKTEESGPSFEGFGSKVSNAIRNPMEAAAGAAEALTAKLGTAGVAASGFGAVAAALGGTVYELAKSFGELWEQQNNNALRLGVSIREYGLFARVSKEAGLSSDALVGTMRGLSKALAENSDEGQKAKEAMARYGIESANAFGAAVPMRDMLLQIADRLGAIENPAEKAATAIKLMGKGALEVLPLMNSDLRTQFEQLERAGAGWTKYGEAVGKSTDAWMDAFDRKWSKITKAAKEAGAVAFLAAVDNDAAWALQQDEKRRQDIEAQKREVNLVSTRGFNRQGTYLGVAGLSDADFAAMDKAARARQIASILGSDPQRQLAATKKSLDDATADGNVDLVRRLAAEYKALEASIKATAKAEQERAGLAKQIGDINLMYFGAMFPNIRALPKANADPGGADRDFLSQLGMSLQGLDDLDATNLALRRSKYSPMNGLDIASSTAKFSTQQFGTSLSQGTDGIKQKLDYQVRLVELMAGPGGEIAAIRTATALKLDALQKEAELGADAYDIEKQRNQLLMDQQIQILAFQKQRDRDLKAQGGSMFDSLTAGGGGIRDYGMGLVKGFGRTTFGNAYSMLMGGTEGKLSLTNDPNSFLGKLFGGTPLGADPMKVATDANTMATISNTMALNSMRLGAVGMGGGISGAAATDVYKLLNGFGGSSWSGTGQQAADAYMFSSGLTDTTGAGRGSSTTMKGIGYAAGLAAAGFGVYSGVKQGGGQGALTATSSALGAAAMIPGPQQPFIAAAALITGVAAAFMGDPKKRRADELASEASNRRWTQATGEDYATDIYGQKIDSNKRGETRVIINVQAIDAKGFMDHMETISEVVRQGFDNYPPLANTARSVLMPA